jgi:hypothetical protein
VFYALHGIGQSYRINRSLVACIAWRPKDEAGNVEVEISFSGGAKVELTAAEHLWLRFLAEFDRKD